MRFIVRLDDSVLTHLASCRGEEVLCWGKKIPAFRSNLVLRKISEILCRVYCRRRRCLQRFSVIDRGNQELMGISEDDRF